MKISDPVEVLKPVFQAKDVTSCGITSHTQSELWINTGVFCMLCFFLFPGVCSVTLLTQRPAGVCVISALRSRPRLIKVMLASMNSVLLCDESNVITGFKDI